MAGGRHARRAGLAASPGRGDVRLPAFPSLFRTPPRRVGGGAGGHAGRGAPPARLSLVPPGGPRGRRSDSPGRRRLAVGRRSGAGRSGSDRPLGTANTGLVLAVTG